MELKLVSEEDIIGEDDLRKLCKKAGSKSKHVGYDTHSQGDIIKRYVMLVLENVEDIPYKGMFSSHIPYGGGRPVDFIWIVENLRLKVKHIYSCLHFKQLNKSWKSLLYLKYDIRYNSQVDIFILTAFKDRSLLEPLHFWIVGAKEKFWLQRVGEIDFWDRSHHFIYDTKNAILKMKKYEHNDKLEKLKEIINKMKENENGKMKTENVHENFRN